MTNSESVKVEGILKNKMTVTSQELETLS